ncbi:LysR family transcriptional regulator [Paraburkholderia caffeinilytica]|uniref:LysR family transcriptional regulator n=1 Tax=Paraburkholderia caffeinilytica TaxID=1761016 RepID=UPI003DA1A9C5
MNLDAVRSFLDVAETGSFSLAAARVSVMQSTVSGRIQSLEDELGCLLFNRGRSGAELTPAGQEFRAYAEKIVQTWDQARQQVALPPGYSGIFRFGGPVALQDRLSVAWVLWMKEHAPGIALQLEGGYSDVLTENLSSGILDAAIMYLPRRRSGLVIEELLQENLVPVQHPELSGSWHEQFVSVDWGHDFRASYSQAFPGAPAPALSVGLGALGLQYVLALKGAAYLPLGLVAPLLADGRLSEVPEAPVFRRPIYLVYPSRSRSPELLEVALSGLRHLATIVELPKLASIY